MTSAAHRRMPQPDDRLEDEEDFRRITALANQLIQITELIEKEE